MSSRLATRSGRLALAAVAMVAVTATLTACGPEETGADAGSSSATKEAGSGSAGKDNAGDKTTAKDNDVDGAKDEYYGDDGGSAGEDNDVDGAKQDHYAKKCDNGDLNFTLATYSEGHGYYLVTAKAKSGVVCFLQGPPQQVMFGSDPDTVAANADQGAGDQIKLKGSTAAYLAVKPDSADTNDGKMFASLIVSVSDDGGEAGMLEISETEGLPVNKPIVSHWKASADAATRPFV